LIGSVRSESL